MARCGCGGGLCACSLAVGDGLSLTGSGSIANPFLLGLDDIDCSQVRPCITGGDGITYDVATGTVSVRPSSDAGNTVQIGTDGGVFAGIECADVRPCISAGDGATYDPVTGVVKARPSTDSGNNLIIGGDGGLFVPSGAATVSTGCGLDGDGSGGDPLTVSTGTWDYPCPLDANAGRVFCDSTGTLRSEPRGRAVEIQAFSDTTYPATAVPAGIDVLVETRNLNVVNPDPCRAAFVIMEVEIDVDLTLPANSGGIYGIALDDMVRMENKGTSTQNQVHTQVTKVFPLTVPAGGAVLDALEVRMGGGFGGATYTRIQTTHRAFIFNL